MTAINREREDNSYFDDANLPEVLTERDFINVGRQTLDKYGVLLDGHL